jgi:hypothetical protein
MSCADEIFGKGSVLELGLGLDTGAPGGPLPIISSGGGEA